MKEYCQNCGSNIKPGTKFCPECGTKVESEIPQEENDVKFCPNCGEKIDHSEGFCQNCGTNLNSPAPVKNESFIEKYKIPIAILVTLGLVCVIIAGTIALAPKQPVDVGSQTVTVGTNRFVIPGDFMTDPSSIDVDYTGYNVVFAEGYSNKEDYIYISVMNIPPRVDGQAILNDGGGVQKTMMGVNGHYTEDGNGTYSFAFVDGAYLNVVTVTSPYLLDKITYRG